MRHSLIICFLIFCNLLAIAQQNIASGNNTSDFTPPVAIPIVLSGTFGELRSNHFHSGLDIKTQGKEGLKTFAIEKGYVSRIKISHYGYGKALYITHPSGQTSVYAHLQGFSKKIEAYVKKQQYAKKTYTLELFPSKNQISVSKGEVIAYTGNSGGSSGPHLHFELRDAQSRPVNPMLEGFDIKDTRKPLVRSIWLYPLDENSHVNGSNEPYQLHIKKQDNGIITSTPIEACGAIGIGVNTVDQQDAAYNKNGVFKISSKLNGTPVFEMELDRFAFSETRHINQLIDYAYFKENRSRITKLFIEESNPLSIYDRSVGNGKLHISPELSYMAEVTVLDVKKNKSVLRIPITGKEETNITTKNNLENSPYVFTAQPSQSFHHQNEKWSVYIPKNALYHKEYLNIKTSASQDTLKLHEPTTPLHKYINISFKNITDAKQKYIAKISKSGKPQYVGSKFEKNSLKARTRDFGVFTICTDTIAPKIRALNFSNNKWISKLKTLRIKITDHETGIKTYHGSINGKFALFAYDPKKQLLVHDLSDGIYQSGKNELKVFVEDSVGNSTIFEAIFYRK